MNAAKSAGAGGGSRETKPLSNIGWEAQGVKKENLHTVKTCKTGPQIYAHGNTAINCFQEKIDYSFIVSL